MSGVAGFTRTLIAVCDTINTVEALRKTLNHGELDVEQALVSGTGLVGLGCNLCEVGVLAGGGKASALSAIKDVESFAKLMQAYARMFAEFE